MGWLAGTVAAGALAYVLVLQPATATAVMPLVVVLRSVPLIAMCPLLGLVFGRGWLGVTVIGGLVTFVPTLVTLVGAFRDTPSSAIDVAHCSGGSRWQGLRKVRTPYATPALFAAAKISMPGAVLGAVLAEWLITSRGLGHMMSIDIISSDYGNLFSAIAVLLIVSLGLYAVIGALESAVRRSMGGV
jgi:ABC-type nitrate/sulfonate/bicarbonate transport system permease component